MYISRHLSHHTFLALFLFALDYGYACPTLRLECIGNDEMASLQKSDRLTGPVSLARSLDPLVKT